MAGIDVLLASDEGSYLTGGIYAVTGGIPLLLRQPKALWPCRFAGSTSHKRLSKGLLRVDQEILYSWERPVFLP